MRDIAHSDNLNDNTARYKRDLVTSDEPNSSIWIAGSAVAGDPAADGAAGVRAGRVAVELPPRRARPRAQPVGDQPSDPRAGTAVRRQAWISALPFFTSTVLIPALADFKRRHPATTLRIEATHQYADFNSSQVDVAIRYGREHSTGLKFEPLVEVTGLPVCAPALIKSGLRDLADLSRQVLIHLTSQPRAWPAWLNEAGIAELTPRGHLWLDSVPAMLEAAEQGLGVTLAMAPLIKARPGFGRKLVAPFDVAARHTETIYLVSRTEQARDRRIGALRRWIIDAVGRAR